MLQQEISQLDVKKEFFKMRMVKHWNGLPKDLVQSQNWSGQDLK